MNRIEFLELSIYKMEQNLKTIKDEKINLLNKMKDAGFCCKKHRTNNGFYVFGEEDHCDGVHCSQECLSKIYCNHI